MEGKYLWSCGDVSVQPAGDETAGELSEKTSTGSWLLRLTRLHMHEVKHCERMELIERKYDKLRRTRAHIRAQDNAHVRTHADTHLLTCAARLGNQLFHCV